jgi:hypothetical protein
VSHVFRGVLRITTSNYRDSKEGSVDLGYSFSTSDMTAVGEQARQHGYRFSGFERNDHDYYPTPADLVASIPLGLSRLGLELPRVVLGSCGGDGALRRRQD